MIEPYSRNISHSDKLKRHHKIIFDMWHDYKSHNEIVKALMEIGCKVERKTVGIYINRCLEECSLVHDYSMPHPKGYVNLCSQYHDRIAHLRNYLGYSAGEIAKEIGVSKTSVYRYIEHCYEE